MFYFIFLNLFFIFVFGRACQTAWLVKKRVIIVNGRVISYYSRWRVELCEEAKSVSHLSPRDVSWSEKKGTL